MRKIYYEKLYNPEIKRHFIEDITDNEDTRRTLYFNFKRASKMEREYIKDLYNMTFDEIEGVLNDCRFKSENAAKGFISMITTYLDWCSINGYKSSNLSVFPSDSISSIAHKYVSKVASVYYTQRDLFEYYDRMNNEMEVLIIQCIFEGIKGQGFDEILSMRIEDVHSNDDNYYITLPNRENDRHQISEYLYKLLYRVNEMDYYEGATGRRNELVPSPYILRKSAKGKTPPQGGKLDSMFISNKLVVLKPIFDTNKFNFRNILKSGAMHFLNEILEMKDTNIVGYEEYEKISDRFNTGKYTNASYDKEFINYTSIKELIDLDFYKSNYGEIELT